MRPPPRHRPSHHTRRRRTVDALLAVTATLALTSIMAAGNAVAPWPRVEQTSDPPVAADRTERVSRLERQAPTQTAATTVPATEDPIPTRACRCQPRQPIETAGTPTVQNTPPARTVVSQTAETPSAGVPVTPTPISEAPSATETVGPTTTTLSTTTAPPTTTTPPETTEPAPTTTTTETTTTATATEETPDV